MLKCFGVTLLGGVLLFSYLQESTSHSVDVSRYVRRRRESDEVECVLPRFPENGEWKLLPKGGVKPGDKIYDSSVIKFKCNPGYKLSSKSPLVLCDENWSKIKFPECEELCPPLYSSDTFQVSCFDKTGTTTSCSVATHGTYIDYTCARFYETPFGYKKTIFCEEGKWTQEKPVCLPTCGRKITDRAGQYIYGVKENDKLEYPWVIALYLNRTGSYENVCGGSILSPTVVLTAAHCVTNDYGQALPKENFAVGAGKLYNKYQAPEDTRAQYLRLSKLIVHDDYKAHDRQYSADLAVLITDGEFVLNEVIQPVCINGLKNIVLKPNSIGEVSGWGVTDGGLPSEVLRTLKIPYKTPDICANELPPEFNDKYNNMDKMCAGYYNKNLSVCNGDSGGGLAFKNVDDNRYYLHGIVSTGHLLEDHCNIQQNALYTKVAQYYEFIDRVISKYAPKIKDCVLPPYPKNGKWIIDNQDKTPGDAVPSTVILKVECNSGYKLSSAIESIECRSAQSMPTCQKLCEPLEFPVETNFVCINNKNQKINCQQAVENTVLIYTCEGGYNHSTDHQQVRKCTGGTWGTPKPECIHKLSCGESENFTSVRFLNTTISHDAPQQALKYPWSISVHISDKDRTYICGGTVISTNAVLTAASCVTDRVARVRPKENIVVVGENLSLSFNLSQVIVNPKYRGRSNEYNDNIAILLTESVLSFYPICFFGIRRIYIELGDILLLEWKNQYNDSFYENRTYEAREIVRVEKENCFLNTSIINHPYFPQCGRFQDTSNCYSKHVGNGLYVQSPHDGKFYIYGIVSNNHLFNEDTPEKECDQNSGIVPFTVIYLYYDFIANIINY